MSESTAPTDQHATRTRLPLRFSLRALLIAVTAFAIGFPVWYRWPYEEDDFRAKGYRQVTSWQRKWGGGRWMHGPRYRSLDGRLTSLETYRRGAMHGSWEQQERDGSRYFGQINEGKRDGEWKTLDARGNLKRRETYKLGVLDGPWELFRTDGTQVRIVIQAGHVVTVNGQNFDCHLNQLLREKRIDSPIIAASLEAPTDLDFVEAALQDVVDFAAEKHEIRIVADPHHADGRSPVVGSYTGLPLISAMEIIAAQSGHTCDYRYGCVWITSPDDARQWRDPTGVDAIRLPMNSQLARAWHKRVVVRASRTPLSDVLSDIAQPLAIELDTTAIASQEGAKPAFPVLWFGRGLSFRNVLGVLLYQSKCRCELCGETLVILPPE